MIRNDIIEELNRIPEAELPEIYRLIHYFRLGLQQEQDSNPTLELAGSWKDIPETEFQDFLQDILTRRHQGFSGRRRNAADFA